MSYNKDTNWDNERKYLLELIETGNNGEKSWGQQQLAALDKAKAQYGGATATPTATNNTVPTSTNPYGEDTNWNNEYAYLTGLSTSENAGEAAWANNQLDFLNDAMSQYGVTATPTTAPVYTPAGTHNDSGLPADASAQIQAYKKAYDDAIARGDTAAAQQAHLAAEAIRQRYGYSGGGDGSEYIEFTNDDLGLSASGILGWNDVYNNNNPQPTYTEPTVDGKSYSEVTEKLLSEILSREDFSYNVENDPLYAQYKTMYNREGDRAMRDTLAEIASSAGGMNSYAVMAAQQANNYYNSQLNDRIPELYQLAYEMYLQDKESDVENLGILTQLDQTQYNRFRDTMSDWRADKDFAYGSYLDSVTQGNTEYDYTTSERDKAKDEVWKLISLGVTPSAALVEKSGMSQTDIDLALAAVEAGSNPINNNNGYNPDDNNNNNNNNNNNGYNPDDNNNNNNNNNNNTAATGVTEEIKTKCASFTSNNSLYDYLRGLVDATEITVEVADSLYAQYADPNEKYKVDESGNATKEYSYSEMIKSTQGWSVDENASKGGKGGGNLFGIDRNAVVIAPNGESMTLNELRNKLLAEKMKKSDATNLIQELQQHLGIANATLFGW